METILKNIKVLKAKSFKRTVNIIQKNCEEHVN